MEKKVAFPPLGILSRVAECYLRALGVTVVTPPATSRRTLDIGVRGSPEMVCIPCKLLFGNYMEAAELGATDMVMLGGPGTCRLGYSVAQQARRLREWGFEVRTHTLDLYHVHRDLLRLTRTLTDGRPWHELVEPLRFLMGLLNLTDALETTALLAREWSDGQPSRFKGFDVAQAEIQATSFECRACPNLCEIAQIRMDGRVVARWGGRCDRWEVM